MFARVYIEIDVSKPLVPGVSLSSLEESNRHEFLYKNISIFYFHYGILEHRSFDCTLVANNSSKHKMAAVMGVEMYMIGLWLKVIYKVEL